MTARGSKVFASHRVRMRYGVLLSAVKSTLGLAMRQCDVVIKMQRPSLRVGAGMAVKTSESMDENLSLLRIGREGRNL